MADATYFLPAYDLRQATLALAALREQQEAAAAALQPRRRFAFNRKASGKAGSSDAAPAAGAAADKPAQQTQQQEQQPADAGPTPQQAQQPEQALAAPPAAAAGGTGSGSDSSTLSGLRGEIVAPPREEAEGREFTLSDLEDCTVFLPAPLAALFLHGLRRCRVYTGPVAGACFVEGRFSMGGWVVCVGSWMAVSRAGLQAVTKLACGMLLPLAIAGRWLAAPCPYFMHASSALLNSALAALPWPAGADDCLLMIAARQVRCRCAC